MFGVILKATNSSLQKGITFCRSIYVKKVMKLLAFIFEQPSYITKADPFYSDANRSGGGELTSGCPRANTALGGYKMARRGAASEMIIS